jgi:hypothetical protein
VNELVVLQLALPSELAAKSASPLAINAAQAQALPTLERRKAAPGARGGVEPQTVNRFRDEHTREQDELVSTNGVTRRVDSKQTHLWPSDDRLFFEQM